jgi:hypothetical protein
MKNLSEEVKKHFMSAAGGLAGQTTEAVTVRYLVFGISPSSGKEYYIYTAPTEQRANEFLANRERDIIHPGYRVKRGTARTTITWETIKELPSSTALRQALAKPGTWRR